MEVVILKYNAGNVQSVMNSLERLGASYKLTDSPEEILKADRVIFPGVGEASTAMKSLYEANLVSLLPTLKQPFLGTCVGMQLLCSSSEEGNTDCLGVFDVPVVRFPKTELKVPQTGWNGIHSKINSRLLEGISNDSYFYFNHSFYVPICKYTIAQTEYGINYSSVLQKDNFYACQFHSEISSNVGEQLFENFLNL
jgi:imidazole glycerol-phosphate synthase subunit HisH